MTRARDLANIADGTFTATDLNLSGTLDVSGDANFDSGTLFVDVSANNVGIGTTSPAQSLHVNSGTGNTVALFESTDASANISFKDNSTTGSTLIGALANDLYFYTSTTEAMRIDSNGNAGIGTDSPAKKLHISSGVNATPTTFRIENTDTSIETGQDVNTIEFYTNDASASGTGVTSEISQVAINAGNQYALTFSTYNASLSEKMRIDHDGNVGMLTGSPLSRLHVNGGDGNNIRYSGATHSVAMGITGSDPFVGSVTNAPLVFLTNGSEKARIDTTGRLLVGGTSAAGSNASIVSEGGVTVTSAKGVCQEFVAGTTGSASTITITFDGNDSSSTAIVEILMYGYNNKYLDYVAGIYATQPDQVLRNVNDGTTSVALSGAAGSSWTATISTGITNPVVKVKATVGGRASAFSTAPTITFA